MLRVWFRFRDWTMGASVCQSIDRVCCERTHMRQPLFLYFHNCLKPANACSIVIDTPSNVSNAIAKCTMTCRILSQFYRLVSLLLRLRRGTCQHWMSMRKLLQNSKRIYKHMKQDRPSVWRSLQKKSFFFIFFATMFAPRTFIFRITANWSISIE